MAKMTSALSFLGGNPPVPAKGPPRHHLPGNPLMLRVGVPGNHFKIHQHMAQWCCTATGSSHWQRLGVKAAGHGHPYMLAYPPKV